MLGVLEAVANAIEEALKLTNSIHANAYPNRMREIRLDILEERKKGYDSDDAKIENLYKEFQITLDAANAELVAARVASGK